MKKSAFCLLVVLLLAAAGLSAQTTAGSTNGMTLNGATGLIIVPDARIGWENAKIGVDVGYGFVWTGGQTFDHLPRFDVSLGKIAEIHGLFQFHENANNDLRNVVLGAKFQIHKSGGSALALGGDVEMANVATDVMDVSSKIYLAATYSGNFFNIPAVTTATIGWQMFNRGDFSSQFIYGMGFSMSLFPDAFKNHVFWITDFSNFSYVVSDSYINLGRGAFNTGVRIRPLSKGSFNLIIDVLGVDLLDTSRGMAVNVSGGMAF